MSVLVPVTAAPLFDPGSGRVDFTIPAGASVATIVSLALPGACEAVLKRTRVALVTQRGQAIIPIERWSTVRPRAGVHVVIRVVPGDELKSILQLVVGIAAAALGQFWLGPMLATSLGISQQLATSIATLGLTALGNLLINALIPPPEQDKPKPTYAISGWKNPLSPDAAVPALLGELRMAPPFAATSYSVIEGDRQYVVALFVWGYGRVLVDQLKIGETAIEDFDEVQLEHREGVASDSPLTLYPLQVLEDPHGVELRRDLPRDDLGEVIDGQPTVDDPVVRRTATDAAEAAVILGFPAGLVRINDKGKPKTRTVEIRIRQRLAGTLDWIDVAVLDITAKVREGFYRQHRWTLPSRGRWEIELTRMTDESEDGQIVDRCVLVALQSYRPEYPLNFDKPLALTALRIKATHQLNGTLDTFNGRARRVIPDWDAATQSWIERPTSNPASHFRWILQGPENTFPTPDAGIDIATLQDWHAFCTAKNLKYDRLHDFNGRIEDQLAAVAAAGRARPRHDGRKWTVAIDRPTDIVVDQVNPRNSRGFKVSRTYFKPPHAFRVPFLDATNDYQSGERIVPWPGHAGEITETERFDLPGKTDPDEIWREARRRMYELMHRPDRFSVVQDGAARVATRGDQIMASWDVLQHTQTAARVIAVRGNFVELDEVVSMDSGGAYSCRFQRLTEADPIGQSVVRSVRTRAGTHRAIELLGNGNLPAKGAIVHFGPSASESLAVFVKDVEPGEDFASVLTMVAAAPIIDQLTDAEVPPAWDGRVGGPIAPVTAVPAMPVVTSISTGVAGADNPNALAVNLRPGPGSSAIVTSYQVQHRLVGAGAWSGPVTGTAASGRVVLNSYVQGNQVEFQVRAISHSGVEGPWSPTRTVIVGGEDLPTPSALPAESISVKAKPGHVEIVFATGPDLTTAAVQVYRDGVAIGTPIPVSPSGTFGRIDGDSTRENLFANTGFDTDTVWTKGAGWGIAGGLATKTAGSAAEIAQAVSLSAGAVYRIGGKISGRTAGTLTPRLSGGTPVAGPAASANGTFFAALTAVAGNTSGAFQADAAFNGSIDDVVIYRATASCIAQGSHSYTLQPLNEDGVPGPVSGPFTVTVI